MIKKLNEDNINITEIEFENLMIKASMNYSERLIAFSLLELGLTETQKNKYLSVVKYPKELEILFEDVPELLKYLNSKYFVVKKEEKKLKLDFSLKIYLVISLL